LLINIDKLLLFYAKISKSINRITSLNVQLKSLKNSEF
jgi:hypothetical protein